MTLSSRPQVVTTDDANFQTLIKTTQIVEAVGLNGQLVVDAANQVVQGVPALVQAQTATALVGLNSAIAAASAAVVTDKKFISTTTAFPVAPTGTDLTTFTGDILGSRLDANGAVQRTLWNRTNAVWADNGAPMATRADLAAASTAATSATTTANAASTTLTGTVNGASYGCVDGANVSKIMDTINAAPDGSIIIIPKGNYVDTGGRKMLTGRSRLKIYMNGSTVKATASLADPSDGSNGGFYFLNCTEIDVYDGTYDGSLDTRTPYGSDVADTNLKSGWNILSGCVGVRLHNVWGVRCMMDGIYIGHRDNTITGQPAVTQTNMPTAIVLDRCGGDGNYRQGMSVVGVNGLSGQGNKFSNTGKTGSKGTAPMAGIDFEAFSANGWMNLGIDLTDTECNGNTGHAVLFENGTDGARLRGIRGTGNGGGLGFGNLSKNCEALSVNLTNGGTTPAEPINLVVDGINNHVRGGTITCMDGSRGGVIKTTGNLCGFHDLTATAAGGTLHTASFITDGPEAEFDNLTVVDGRQTIAGYGVIDMRGVGNRLSGQTRVVGYNGDTTSIPVVMTQGTATQPSISGYTQPADLRVSGTRLAPVPGITFARSSGRAFTLGTVTATLEVNTPDRLVYRLSATLTTSATNTEPFGVVAVSGYGSYVAHVLSASANDAGTGTPYLAGTLTQPYTAIVATTPSVAQGIQLILLVELTR